MRKYLFAVVTAFTLCVFVVPAVIDRVDARDVVVTKAYTPAATVPANAVRTYFQANTASIQDLVEFRAELIKRGARAVNLFLPDVLVCELPADLDVTALSSYPAVWRLEETQIRKVSSADMNDRLSFVRMCYERAGVVRSAKSHGISHAAGQDVGFKDVVLINSPETADKIQKQLVSAGMASPGARNINQNSEFFGGDILARLVLPESNGLIDAQTENWSDEEIAAVNSGARAAMLAVQGDFPNMPMHFIFETFARSPTAYEPIQYNMDTDYLWVMDTMRRIDPKYNNLTTAQAMVHAFNNDGRKQFGTDFVFTGFVANSENSPDHRFVNAWYTAYANLGGPYNVDPYPAGLDPNGIGEWLVFSKIFQHETGHVFWALDEYLGAPGFCTGTSGYLNYQNLNKLTLRPDGEIWVCDPDGPFDCIMQNAPREDVGRPWCIYSQGHIGVVDAEGLSGVPDIFEAQPTIEWITPPIDTFVAPDTVTVRFRAISQAVPNQNRFIADRIDYAAPLHGGKYDVDGGTTGIIVSPVDGEWDDAEEEVAVKISVLPGASTVNVSVRTSVDYWSETYNRKIVYIGVNYFGPWTVVTEDGIELKWDVYGDYFNARFDVYRAEPGEDMPDAPYISGIDSVGPPQNGILSFEFPDNEVDPGKAYRYLVVARISLGETRQYEIASNVIETTAMLPAKDGFMSTAAPNPFNEITRVSVVVPKTMETASDAGYGGGTTTFERRVPTPVDIEVFDVLGRRIKLIYSEDELRDVLTVSWDGTDSANRSVPSGVYFIRTKAGPDEAVRKVLLVR